MRVLSPFILFVPMSLAVVGCGSDTPAANTTSTSTTGGAGGASSTSSGHASSGQTSSGNASSTHASSGHGGSTHASTGAGTGAGGGAGASGPCDDHPMPASMCKPHDPSCNTNISDCLPIVDNTGKTKFDLRMSSLALSAPAVFTSGHVASTLVSGVTQTELKCNLSGSGLFNWLLEFDQSAQTIRTGGAKPVADPTSGYSFMDEMAATLGGMIRIQPVSATLPSAGSDCSVSAPIGDVVMPVFLSATVSLFLPLRSLEIDGVSLTSDNNCIGSYDAASLDPSQDCQPPAATSAFKPAGKVKAFINLSDADDISITLLDESLCVVLSGDATMYGNGASPTAQCKKKGGKIVFQGDWCTATNAAADAGCADAVRVEGDFSASAIKVN